MFREMRRFKQALTKDECQRILKEQWRGVLALLGDEGYPYTVPMDFYYEEDEESLGRFYFHCAGEGHKIDAIRNCDKASFCVYDQGFIKDGDWALNISSVVSFGRMRILTDRIEIIEKVTKLGLKYYPSAEEALEEVKKDGHRVTVLELTVEHMTGKLINEK